MGTLWSYELSLKAQEETRLEDEDAVITLPSTNMHPTNAGIKLCNVPYTSINKPRAMTIHE